MSLSSAFDHARQTTLYSFIIITHNEEDRIESVIKHVQSAAAGFSFEIIVADGASSDRTVEILQGLEVTLVQSDPGRGVQLRRGVRHAKGDVLIFLHGDTLFPRNGLQVIDTNFHTGVRAATLRMRFDDHGPLLQLYRWFTRFDSVLTSFGDQCIIVARDIYEKTGGFPAWQLFEDVEFLRRLRREVRIRSLPAEVITSSRRFRNRGVVKQQLQNLSMMVGFYLGLDHHRLKLKYAGERLSTRSALAIFTDNPRPNRHKTSLAAAMGEEKAASFYGLCSEHTFSTARQLDGISTFVFPAAEEVEQINQRVGDDFNIQAQCGNDLGQRIYGAAKYLRSANYNRIIIIGTDIPDISASIISHAVEVLENKDFVLGPSRDGGYYLIGLKEINLVLFEEIDWSTNRVLTQTIDKINQMGCSYELLEQLTDIDFLEDLNYWFKMDKTKSHPISMWLHQENIF
jgi:rSAM/selenodomain-associated transferase 2/rSAM/selenodomain-associated transferase 1